MNYHKIYTITAVFFLVVFSGFLCKVCFWPHPQHANALPIGSPMPQTQAPADNNPSAAANFQAMETIPEQAYQESDSKELLLAENSVSENSIIEISPSDSQSEYHFASTGDSAGGSDFSASQSQSPLVSPASSSSSSTSSSGSPSSQGPVPAGGGGSSGGSGSSGSSSGGSGSSASGGSGGSDSGSSASSGGDGSTADTATPSSGSSGSGSSGGGGGVVQPDYSLPDWILQDGIRAGFMSSTQGLLGSISSFVEVTKNIGLNTAIVYGCSFAEAPIHLKSYREWLQRCNQAGLHVFAFYAWQPPVGNTCRPVVFADGTEGLFPCPLDNKLWQNYFMADMADKLAKLSVEGPHYQFDGFFLDMEMYRTEAQPEAKKHYSFDTCFCDFCFSRFILDATPIKDIPLVSKGIRKSWLSQNGYLTSYHAYLTEQVEARAQELKTAVHAINPKLLFGVYPAINDTNWVRTAVMRAFGRDSYPVISFTTDTYGYYGNRAIPSTWGANRIPADLNAYFEKYDINGIYAAGYLFRSYTSSEMREHLVKSCQKAQGYWLFRMPQLLEDNIPESEALAGGTQAEYLQAIKNANAVLGTR
jgi:hypothetical protein